jgi:hypothetical protein
MQLRNVCVGDGISINMLYDANCLNIWGCQFYDSALMTIGQLRSNPINSRSEDEVDDRQILSAACLMLAFIRYADV